MKMNNLFRTMDIVGWSIVAFLGLFEELLLP